MEPGPRSAKPSAGAAQCHMPQARGCGCNAGRAPPRAGRERAAPTRGFADAGAGRRKACPPRVEREMPQPPPFSFSGIFRKPERAAGWEGGGEGEGSSGHALGTGGATRRARGRRCPHCPAGRGPERARPPAGPGRARLCPRPALASRRPRPLTWVAFPHGLRGEEERALLDERLMEAVELPVHVGVGDSGGEGGVGEARAARRRLRSAHAGGGVPLGSGGRRGMNGAAGGRARYLYAAPARARPPRAPLRRSAGADGAARRGQLGRNHRRAAGRGAAARPCSERRTIVSVRSKW